MPAALAEGEVGDGQWLRAKGSDTFLPMGSVLVTADEIDDPQALRLQSWRLPGSGPDDGAEILMQDGTTADMIWGVAELIEFISRSITLEPGDIIATGTPAGVGVFRDPPVYLLPGDRVRCSIEGIGAVENPVVAWTDVEDEDDARRGRSGPRRAHRRPLTRCWPWSRPDPAPASTCVTSRCRPSASTTS